jgi:copper chaperone CopZ
MYQFKVSGMTCPSCARALKKALSIIDSNIDVEVNLPMQTIKVKSLKSAAEISRIIEEAGYPVTNVTNLSQQS